MSRTEFARLVRQSIIPADAAKVLSWVHLAIASLVILIVLQQVVSLGGETRIQRAFNNSAHTPWFFIITMLLWVVSAKFQNWGHFRRLAGVVGAAFALAVGLELVQIFSYRDASLSDVLLNLSGAGAAVLTITAVRFWQQRSISIALGLLLCALFLFVWSFSGVVLALWQDYRQESLAPELINFSSQTDVRLRGLRGDWSIVQTPHGWTDTGYENVARIHLNSSRRWPGLTVREPFRDWRDYDFLEIEAFLEDDLALPLVTRLETASESGTQYISSFSLEPGSNRLRIPLENIVGGHRNWLGQVRLLYLYSESLETDKYFFLASLRLGKYTD